MTAAQHRAALRTPTRLRRALLIPGILTALLGLLLSSQSAWAAWVSLPVTGTPGYLELLWEDATPQHVSDYVPGEPVHWALAVRLEDAAEASLSLHLRADGALVNHGNGLTLEVSACAEEFSDVSTMPLCASGAQTVLPRTRVADVATASSSEVWDLDLLRSTHDRYLLLIVNTEQSLADDPSLGGLGASLEIGLTATSLAETTPFIEPLATTGQELLGPLLLAGGLLTIGIGTMTPARGRASRAAGKERER